MKNKCKSKTPNCQCCICHPELHKASQRMKGKHQSDVSRKKIGEASKSRWADPEYKARVSKAVSKGKTGVKFSETHKAALKKNHKGRTGKSHSLEQRRRISKTLKGHPGAKNQPKYVKHHIYLRQHSDVVIELTAAKHNSLHKRAYDYIYATQGEKGIDAYLKWFDKHFGLRE